MPSPFIQCLGRQSILIVKTIKLEKKIFFLVEREKFSDAIVPDPLNPVNAKIWIYELTIKARWAKPTVYAKQFTSPTHVLLH